MSKRRKLRQDVEIEGLQGQVDAYSEFEPKEFGVKHKLCYRNRLGQRLTFKFDSLIDSDGQRYVATEAKSDAISPDGRLWIHSGMSETGTRKFSNGTADILAEDGSLKGSVKVRYECRGDAPYSRPYSGHCTLPLT